MLQALVIHHHLLVLLIHWLLIHLQHHLLGEWLLLIAERARPLVLEIVLELR
jgi:hypothetical protein